MKICRFCKHSKIISVPDTPYCITVCKKHFTIGTVSGFKQYIKCEHQNPNGNCQEYEESFFRKLINKIL